MLLRTDIRNMSRWSKLIVKMNDFYWRWGLEESSNDDKERSGDGNIVMSNYKK